MHLLEKISGGGKGINWKTLGWSKICICNMEAMDHDDITSPSAIGNADKGQRAGLGDIKMSIKFRSLGCADDGVEER